jgi:2-oxoisovalerate dehydrogenase E2 component (dihydrolipoyl transacylase)
MSDYRMKMPDLGEGVVEAELVSWYVGVGDTVTTETPIAEIVTDKASVEVNAPVDGVIIALLVDEGAIVTVGSDLLSIEHVGPGAAASAEPTGGGVDSRPERHEPFMPADGPDRLPARATSIEGSDDALRNSATSERSSAPTVQNEGTPHASTRPTPPQRGIAAVVDSSGVVLPQRALAAPTVRRRAREFEVDLGSVRGSGPGGRVLMTDLEEHQERAAVPALHRRPDQTEEIRGVRRTIAQRLSTSWQAPHITYVDSVDITELETLRGSINDELEGTGRHVTLLPFFARAIVMACVDHPKINSTYDADAGILRTYGAVHLGIATQTDRGLLVPVISDADQRSLFKLTDEIRDLVEACRDNKIDRQKLTGSTITLTSLGALGGIMNTPILNAPEVAIVGINKVQVKPQWNGSSFIPRSVLNLSSSFDHRIIDGWDAARFVQRVKHLLEAPGLLTLGWTR